MLRLRIDPSLSSRQTIRFVTTDGTPVLVSFAWNERSGFWYIDITQTLKDGSTTSFTGVKLTPGYPALQGVKSLYAFPGDFILLPTQSTTVNRPVGYGDLGSTWYLCWLSDAEAAIWRTSNGLR